MSTAARPGYVIHPGTRIPIRKTPLMRQVEKRFLRPIIPLLAEEINRRGLSGAAKRLRVSKATISYWALKLRIEIRRVALRPGETLRIIRPQ